MTIYLCVIFVQEKRNSNYCETTDKDSSDEHSTISSSISTKVKSRGLHEKGYVYYLVRQDTWEHCWVRVIFRVKAARLKVMLCIGACIAIPTLSNVIYKT